MPIRKADLIAAFAVGDTTIGYRLATGDFFPKALS